MIEIGSGTGEVVRWLCNRGARAIGIDLRAMIEKTRLIEQCNCETYLIASGGALPLGDRTADALIYIASFHHLPTEQMKTALNEAWRVLKPAGRVVLVEPMARAGSFYELTRLPFDEKELLRQAYQTLQEAGKMDFQMLSEDLYYFERTFFDFLRLMRLFFDDSEFNSRVLAQARDIHSDFAKKAGVEFNTFTFQSICRRNVLQKL